MTTDWPPFAKKEVILGNLESPIGVCTLWTPRERFVKQLAGQGFMERVAIVGNLYSLFGVGILVRNYLANPNLTTLLVTGTELGVGKHALQELTEGRFDIHQIALEPSHIERFLRQVHILYLNPKEVFAFLAMTVLQKLESPLSPLIVPLPEPKATVFPSGESGHLIKADTIAFAHAELLREIRTFGHITKEDSEGHRRQELWNLTVVVRSQDPVDFRSIPHPEYHATMIEEYCVNFWKGTEPMDVTYRYGHIIRHGFGDQVEKVINAFRKKEETFRTVISLWDPDTKHGSMENPDPPCIVTLHPRITAHSETLHLYAYIRTNDMFNGWPLNAAALRYFQFKLAEQLCMALNKVVHVGELSITSGSAHLYERDWLRADIVKPKITNVFIPDPKGNFDIGLEENAIMVRHFSPDGKTLLQVFRGTNAEQLSKDISPFVSEIRNALYIGRELMKAQLNLQK